MAMKTFSIAFIICGLFFFSIIGCGETTFYEPSPNMTIDSLNLGTDSTLDVVTWNLQNFPKNGNTTLDCVVEIIQELDVDIIALQEIKSYENFSSMVSKLADWSGYCTNSADYNYNLAYIYKTEIEIEISEILTNDSRPLPRSPLVMEFRWNEISIVIINNHLKCCGDGILDLDDEWDDETRRFDACVLLEDYIATNHPNDNVILLGDLNDDLTDVTANNVFQIFLEDSLNYKFADMNLAEGSYLNWSWQGWGSSYPPCQLDHIMITNELFDEFLNISSDVQTIKVDEYFDGGFNEYYENISDHRPVALKLYLERRKIGRF